MRKQDDRFKDAGPMGEGDYRKYPGDILDHFDVFLLDDLLAMTKLGLPSSCVLNEVGALMSECGVFIIYFRLDPHYVLMVFHLVLEDPILTPSYRNDPPDPGFTRSWSKDDIFVNIQIYEPTHTPPSLHT